MFGKIEAYEWFNLVCPTPAITLVFCLSWVEVTLKTPTCAFLFAQVTTRIIPYLRFLKRDSRKIMTKTLCYIYHMCYTSYILMTINSGKKVDV